MRRHTVRAASAALAALLSACGSSTGGDPRDTTPPQPPVAALVSVAQRAPGSADGVSGAAGAVERGVDVVARAASADGAELGRVTAAADGSFAEIPVGDNLHDTIALLAIDGAGNVSTTATIVTNDIVPPDTALDPSLQTTGVYARFAAVPSEPEVTFRCSVDGGAAAACAWPFEVGPLAPGAHTFSVAAVDLAGNTDPTPASASWDVAGWTSTTWSSVSVGSSTYGTHACGIASDGRLLCWGANRYGALGVGDTAARLDPALVGTGYEAVSVGGHHGCAIAAGGTLRCWGSKACDTTLQQLTPVQCASGLTWTQVSAGTGYTCAIDADGRLLCWGVDGYGQLGDGGSTTRWTPEPVSTVAVSGTRWTAVSTATYHACALRDDASLWCWGANSAGYLGDGTTETRRTPVSPGGSWLAVSTAFSNSCGLKPDGTLWCWGSGYDGGTNSKSPMQVGTGKDFVGVSAADEHVCAWRVDGSGACYGSDLRGELAMGFASNAVSAPLPIAVARMASAYGSSCAITASGELRCWGSNESGAIGVGARGSSLVPVRVSPETFTALDLSDGTLCGVAAGARLCTGRNQWAMLGDGSSHGSAALRAVDGGRDWTAVSIGNSFGLGLRGDGALWGWGWSNNVFVGGPTLDPVLLSTRAWSRIEGSSFAGLAIDADGALVGWGSNGFGVVGDGTKESRPTPVPVANGGTWSSVSACGSHACGIRTDGTLWCWGANQYGQLGDGTTTESLEPAQVGTSAGWSSVSVRTGTTCGIRDQTVSCWGNGYGTAPVTVGVGTPFDEVASGQVHECALSAGRLYCWGTNFDGNLGTGDQTSRSTPTRIGTADDWTALALSSRTSCGLRAGGQLWCWGANEYGVFGDGTSFYPSPMLVPLPALP